MTWGWVSWVRYRFIPFFGTKKTLPGLDLAKSNRLDHDSLFRTTSESLVTDSTRRLGTPLVTYIK